MIAEILLLLTFATCMGWAGRMDGGAEPKTPEWFDRTIVMMPIFILASAISLLLAIPSIVGVLGVATGHGQYFLSRVIKAISPERVDAFVRLFFGQDPRTHDQFKHLRGIAPEKLSADEKTAIEFAMNKYGMTKLYWRNIFGLATTGAVVTLPLAIGLALFGHFIAALIAFVAGAQKAVGYVLGYYLEQKGISKKFIEPLQAATAIGEFSRMFILTIFMYIIYKLVNQEPTVYFYGWVL